VTEVSLREVSGSFPPAARSRCGSSRAARPPFTRWDTGMLAWLLLEALQQVHCWIPYWNFLFPGDCSFLGTSLPSHAPSLLCSLSFPCRRVPDAFPMINASSVNLPSSPSPLHDAADRGKPHR